MTESSGKVAEGNELIASRLERLFFTPEGGMLGNPDWGSRIPGEFFFEQADEITANEIINEMNFLLGTYETELSPLGASVDILAGENGNNAFIIKTTIESPNSGEEEPVEIEFFKIAEIR
jgi:hypothetical protein